MIKSSFKPFFIIWFVFVFNLFCSASAVKKCPVEILDMWCGDQTVFVKARFENCGRITDWVLCGFSEEDEEVLCYESKKNIMAEGEVILEIECEGENDEFCEPSLIFFRQIFFEDGSFWADPLGQYGWIKE